MACWCGVLDLTDETTAKKMAPMNSRNSTSNPSTMETTIQAVLLADDRRGAAGE
jgi:hypothetical protein